MSATPRARLAGGAPSRPPAPPLPRLLVPGLLVLVLFLVGTAVPGPFTLDETNYVVTLRSLREGGVHLRETEGLTFSPALRYYDPTPFRAPARTPVASSVPFLWAILAWPFGLLGWRGLVALQALAFAVTLGLTWWAAARWSGSARSGWLALACLGLGSSTLEYAQGIWPHCLSMALLLGAWVLLDPGGEEEGLGSGLGAGLLAGGSLGLRYANVLFAGGLVAALLFTRARWLRILVFLLGLLPALAVSSWVNHQRIDSWNPVSKGRGYGVAHATRHRGRIGEAAWVLWTRVVDYRARPVREGGEAFYRPAPVTGAFPIGDEVVGYALKKSWVQSSPWILLALVGTLLAWAGAAPPGSAAARLRALGVGTGSVWCVFALLGFGRHDGLGFNQRYMLDALPWMALACGLLLGPVLRDREEPGVPLVRGFSLGVVLGGWPLVLLPDLAVRRHAWLSFGPLVLAVGLLVLWFQRARRGRALLLVLGVSLGWSAAVHLGDDVRVSRNLRLSHWGVEEKLAQVLPERAALFLSPAQASTVAGLLLDPGRDLVGVGPGVDQGRSAPGLVRELLATGRRVFVIENNMGAGLLERVTAGFRVAPVVLPPEPPSALRLLELRLPEPRLSGLPLSDGEGDP